MVPKHGQRLCVVGAGSSGLIMARELLASGVSDFVVFEIQQGPGGLYLRDNYEYSCHTSSMCYTSFACFPPKDVTQCGHFTLSAYVKYLEDFVESFGLQQHIYYGTEVIAVRQVGQQWEVKVREVGSPSATPETIMFDVVICASGTHTNYEDPKEHPWLDGFTGDIYHSSEFRTATTFENKRVIICGGGESASDVSIHTSRVAAQTWIAMRSRTGHITPRGPHIPETDHDSSIRREAHRKDPEHFPPDAAFDLDLTMALYSTSDFVAPSSLYKDVVAMCTTDFFNGMKINVYNKSFVTNQFGTKNAGFSSAIARYGCIPKPPVAKCDGSTVTFEDGTTAKDIDAIIVCVGYKNNIFFLEDELKKKLLNPRNSLKHVVHPDVDRMYLVGFVRPAFGNIPTLAEMQARWVAQLISGRVNLPPRDTMLLKIEADREFEENAFTSGKRIKALTSYYAFAMDLADLTDSHPDYARLLFEDPMLLLKMVTGQFCGYFFKLKEAKTVEDYARYRKIIMDMPLAAIWHMDLAIFITSFNLFLIFGGLAPGRFSIKGNTPFHRMSTTTRRTLAVVLLLNPIYVLFVAFPMAYITILLTLLIQFNSVRVVSNVDYLRGICRPSYYVAKGPLDWFHKRWVRYQLTIFLIATLPYDLFMVAFLQKHLVNQSDMPRSKFLQRQLEYKRFYSQMIVFD